MACSQSFRDDLPTKLRWNSKLVPYYRLRVVNYDEVNKWYAYLLINADLGEIKRCVLNSMKENRKMTLNYKERPVDDFEILFTQTLYNFDVAIWFGLFPPEV